MTWGTKFTKDIQEGTSKSATSQIACAQDVVLNIKGVCIGATGDYKITVANDGTADVEKFKVRLYESQTKADSVDGSGNFPLTSFGIGDITATPSTLGLSVKKVELIPTIKVEGAEVTCAQNTATFGDTSGSAITTPC